MPKVQITEEKINNLGNKITTGQNLEKDDQELLVTTFALAGEAIKNRTAGVGPAATGLSKGLIEGFKGSVGPQIGRGGNPAALDVGVDVNVNW